MSDYVIGIDLGGTNVKAGVVDDAGKVVAKHALALNRPKTRRDVLDGIYRATEETLKLAKMQADGVRALGIATPGTLDIAAGVVVKANNIPEWENVPLRDLLSERFGVPALLENDANAAAWGEYWVGAGKDVSSMVMLTLGTGIGGGVILDGKLWHGFRDSAAEIGHMTIDYRGRQCACGNIGCLEAYASADSTVRRFIEAVRSGKPTNLERTVTERPEQVTAKLIHEEALKGDALSRKILEESGFYLGVGITSILHVINPEMVVLTGGMIGAGEMLMESVRRVVSERAVARTRQDVKIEFARLGGDAGFIGAAGCALTGSETSAS
ncbi:MAG TPA: ROK family protein [Planctomycetota bacterium]|nr:ROK family protein [Planctomycetota bacterium]HUV39789.1 ROK family protein [Planctomycetota bacterium]